MPAQLSCAVLFESKPSAKAKGQRQPEGEVPIHMVAQSATISQLDPMHYRSRKA
jgi:hypothetical protein